ERALPHGSHSLIVIISRTRVLWADEAKVKSLGFNTQPAVLRKPHIRSGQKTVNHSGGGLMVWVCSPALINGSTSPVKYSRVK
uniref:Uncharacterized protein n=1 Tax=Kryptolebias marmoratus TaxID=37003 RepID=A0A3Q2ZUV7_KRYMA